MISLYKTLTFILMRASGIQIETTKSRKKIPKGTNFLVLGPSKSKYESFIEDILVSQCGISWGFFLSNTLLYYGEVIAAMFSPTWLDKTPGHSLIPEFVKEIGNLQVLCE